MITLYLKIYVFDPVPDPNITTFRPLDQMTGSNIRYNGNGYLPCNGYVPCQVIQYFLEPPVPLLSGRKTYFVSSRLSYLRSSWKRDWRMRNPVIITRIMEQDPTVAGEHSTLSILLIHHQNIKFNYNMSQKKELLCFIWSFF